MVEVPDDVTVRAVGLVLRDDDVLDEHAATIVAAAIATRMARTSPWWLVAFGHMASLVPTCVWRARSDVVIALDDRFGEPVDAYVNGSHVWLRDDGPNGITLEWRLHPVAGYRQPADVDTYELFSLTAQALRAGTPPPASLDRLWDGLEAFAAYGDEVEPAPLAAAVVDALGIAPDAVGIVDHDAVGDAWERARGRVSIVDALLSQIDRPSPTL